MYETIDRGGPIWLHIGDSVCEIMYVCMRR